MWDAARGIVSQRGPMGLYSGLSVTLMEIMPYAALQFGLYDALNAFVDEARFRYQRDMAEAAKAVAAASSPGAAVVAPASMSRRHSTRQRESPEQPGEVSTSSSSSLASSSPSRLGLPPSRLQAFACGLLAGLLAKLATHPLDVAKKRYQVAGLQRSLRYGARVEAGFAMRSLCQSLAYIYRTEGVMGLWKGSVPSIVKAAPSAAITFAAYDAVLSWLLVVSGEQQLRKQREQEQLIQQQLMQQQDRKQPHSQ
ncbi:hypothetical protein Vretimale_10862 [Volvox reticuliferus]|nr:hypothetical protein Vretifemale_12577 [Volvox reticuliferus]GIM06584.1 hypothetical protein Vretimale_10862 [Volvox reticuliferus]